MSPEDRERGRHAGWIAALLLVGFALGLWTSEGIRQLFRRAPGPALRAADLGSSAPRDFGTATALPDAGLPARDGGLWRDGGSGPSAAAPSPPGQTLWVDVLDAKGQPAAGATVTARLFFVPGVSGAGVGAARPGPAAPVGELGVLSGALPFPEDIIAGRATLTGQIERGAGGSDLAVSATAQTDESGVARLAGVPVGRVQVTAAAGGLSATGEVRILPAVSGASDGAGLQHLVLRLAALTEATCALDTDDGGFPPAASALAASEGPEIAGQLVDGRGFPVSGARVEVTLGRARGEQLTDGRGRFSVRGLPRGAGSVQVRAAGFAPLVAKFPDGDARSELRLVLQPGGGISGVLRDRRLGSVPDGAELVLETPGERGVQRQPLPLGPGGRFTATGLVPGEATLRARAPGFAPAFLSVQIPAGQGPGEITARDLRVELEQGARLTGQVRTQVGSGTVASLEVVDTHGRVVGKGASRASGDFELTDLPAGRLEVRATSGSATGRASVELRPGDDARADLDLR